MEGDPKAAVEAVEQDRNPRNRGIGLCLSGGGFRATLFHLGAIQRLFELGIATRPDWPPDETRADAIVRPDETDRRAVGFDTVASVSGGSIAAAQWAVAQARLLRPMPSEGGLAMTDVEGPSPSAPPSLRGGRPLSSDEAISPFDFTRYIARPILTLTGTDLRTGPLAKKLLLPWNWFRGAYATNAMVARLEDAFGQGTLNLLPDHPRFVFCATDMAFGAREVRRTGEVDEAAKRACPASFIFDRDRVGSYLAGYAPPDGFTLAQAWPPRPASRRSSARCASTAPPRGSKEGARPVSAPMREGRSCKTSESRTAASTTTWASSPCGRATAWCWCQTRAA